ncbi:MAG: hypothetical protein ACOYB8_01390 [Eubacteriaceae bacterium]
MKQKTAAVITVILMAAVLLLTGCDSEPNAQQAASDFASFTENDTTGEFTIKDSSTKDNTLTQTCTYTSKDGSSSADATLTYTKGSGFFDSWKLSNVQYSPVDASQVQGIWSFSMDGSTQTDGYIQLQDNGSIQMMIDGMALIDLGVSGSSLTTAEQQIIESALRNKYFEIDGTYTVSNGKISLNMDFSDFSQASGGSQSVTSGETTPVISEDDSSRTMTFSSDSSATSGISDLTYYGPIGTETTFTQQNYQRESMADLYQDLITAYMGQ